MKTLILKIGALLACLTMLGCGASKTETFRQIKYDSPQSAFDGFSNAGREGDWQTLAISLTPESQETLAAMLMIPAGMLAAFDETAGKDLEDIMERHGLDQVNVDQGDNLPIKDKAAFIAEVAELLMRQGGETSDLGIPVGSLSEVLVDGDSATAKIDDEPISFRFIDGGWLVHLETPAEDFEDIPFSSDPLHGRIHGEYWQVKSVEKGPFGGFKLLGKEKENPSDFANGPQVMLGESWNPMKPGSGRLSGRRNITFYVPPGSNTICMTGKYEISETDEDWILFLIAIEGNDTSVNGRVTIPKKLGR